MTTRKRVAADTAPAAAASVYDPEAEYEVRLMRPAAYKGRPSVFLPMHARTMSGALLTRIVEENGADVIDTVRAL